MRIYSKYLPQIFQHCIAPRWLMRFIRLAPMVSVSLALLLAVTTAQAVAVNFDGGAVRGCTLSGSAYTCSSVPTTTSDAFTIAAGYVVTVDPAFNIQANTGAIAAGAGLNGNLSTRSTVSLAADAYVNGNLSAGSTLALDVRTHITGLASAGSSLAMGADAYVVGDASAGTTMALGANATVSGKVTAGTTLDLGAGAYARGNITAGTTATLGAGAYGLRNLKAGTTATLGADAFVCGHVDAADTLTMGAGAFVSGNITTTTATIDANGYVNGRLTATTATLGAGTCYGSIRVTTLTDAGDGVCTLPRPTTKCSTSTPAGAAAASFSCLESSVNTPWIAGARRPLFTKLTGTAFAFDVVALKTDGSIEANYVASGGAAKPVTVELVDGSGSLACTSRTPISPAISQISSFAATDAGRKTTAPMTVAKAYADLRCRVTDASQSPNVVACSSDNFSVRPLAVTLITSANALAPSVSATPAIKAGVVFTLGGGTTTTDGYTGVLNQDTSKLTAQTPSATSQQSGGVVGALTPAFLTANAASVKATYSEVGYLYLAPGAYRDDTFTAVDSAAGDCLVNSLADTLDATGKYGCSIGTKGSVSLGRFYPDHFAVTLPVFTPGCGTFTYMGQPFTLTASVQAQNAGAGLTQNFAGNFATGATVLAVMENANSGTPLNAARLAGQSTPAWTAGSYAFAATSFTREAAPDGVYDNLDIGLQVLNVETTLAASARPYLINRDMDASNISCMADPNGTSNGTCTATRVAASAKLRYGRIRMQNAYGSELQSLPIPIEAQYWAGSYYVTSTQDSCTRIALSNITMGNYTKTLSACKTQLTSPPSPPTGSVAMAAGRLPAPGIVLTKPGAGNIGSVDLTYNLGSTPTPPEKTCIGATQSDAMGANMPWFGATNTIVRATFGIFKSPFIYRRENY